MHQDHKDTFREEYNFSGGVRGKHHEAYAKGTNVMVLERDAAEVVRDSATVNRASRAIAQVAQDQADSTVGRAE